jgi:lysylphosphatidylglycerol synthetase-like protein (DUF2156 family)
MTEPRNVTPDQKPEPAQSEWWGWNLDSRRRGFPLLGVLLVLIGVGLLIQQVVPAVSVGTLVLLALGLALLASWAIGRSWFSMIPGFLLLALGVAGVVRDLRYVPDPTPGITALALAAAFAVIWLVAFASGRRRYTWALWAAAILGLIGAVQISGKLTGLPELSALWPIVIIVLGIIALINWQRRR